MPQQTVQLTALEIAVILDSLHAHLAGDTSEGDLSWDEAKDNAAIAVVRKLSALKH